MKNLTFIFQTLFLGSDDDPGATESSRKNMIGLRIASMEGSFPAQTLSPTKYILAILLLMGLHY